MPANLITEPQAWVGDADVLVLELAKRAYSELLHDFPGWSEGPSLPNEPEVQGRLMDGIPSLTNQGLST